jgi:phosphoglycerate dehydrogenase-like enzyme
MTTGDRRAGAAPLGAWGRAKVLALLVAGALAGLLPLVGVGLALYYGFDPSPAPGKPASTVPPQKVAADPHRPGDRQVARRDDLAAAPMPPGSATDAQPSVLSTRNPGSIALPQATTRCGGLDERELSEALVGVQLLGIRSGTRVSASVLAGATDLIAVGAFCIGTNQIDLVAAAARGVAVFNAPFSNARSVVELALAEMICLTRGVTAKSHALHSGVWDKSARGSHEMRGRTLGIIGYGNIGSQLSVLAEALGMRVVFFDTADRLARGNAHSVGSVAELLEVADVVTLHVAGRVGNAGLFGAEQFAAMRPGSVFLNLSRGFVVEQGALAEHIRSGHIVGAAKVGALPAAVAERGGTLPGVCGVQQPGGETGAFSTSPALTAVAESQRPG